MGKNGDFCRMGQAELDVPGFRNGEWRSITDTVTREVALAVRWTDSVSGAQFAVKHSSYSSPPLTA